MTFLSSRRAILAAALAFVAFTVAMLRLRPALPIDETRYLTVAWEMWRDGTWLVPHLNGAIYGDKPPLLFWLNRLYLRVTGVLARLEADQREAGWSRRVGGPLEPLLIASLVIAVIAFAVWFLVYAEDPLVRI